jgi:hypothetical protein
MVLKVVRGKILDTLELGVCWMLSVPFRESLGRDGRPDIRPWKCCRVRLSKIEYYLVDNIYIFMLTLSMGRIQEESGRTSGRLPNWNEGGAGKGGSPLLYVQLRKTPPKRSLDGAPSRVKRAIVRATRPFRLHALIIAQFI